MYIVLGNNVDARILFCLIHLIVLIYMEKQIETCILRDRVDKLYEK